MPVDGWPLHREELARPHPGTERTYLGVREGNKKEAVRGEPRTANLTGPRAVVSQRPATLVLRRQSHENYVYFFTLKKAEMVEPSLAVITAR